MPDKQRLINIHISPNAGINARFDSSYIPEPNTGCWLWYPKSLNLKGYAQMWNGWQLIMAHRYSYIRFIGPISSNMEIDHKCRIRSCVNPAHLDCVTHLENIQRATQIRTHCPSGHLLAGDNLRLEGKNNARRCKLCKWLNRPSRRNSS